MRRPWRAMFALLLFAGAAHGQIAGRLIEDVDVSERPGRIDVNLIFACELRYLSHIPASEGELLRIRVAPQADCGSLNGILSGAILPNGTDTVIRTLDVDQLPNGEISIAIRWSQSEKYFIVPTADSRGLRIRILRSQAKDARVFIGETNGGAATYALNLESSQNAYSPEAVRQATDLTGLHAYVSQVTVREEVWYRLRVGPFRLESDARRLLLQVRERYPKAWLAIADDDVLNADDTKDSTPSTTAPQPGANTTLTTADIESRFTQAKTAVRKKDYATAIPLLTQLLEQPEFPKRAEAQELLGLARERNRQFAHAKAEYEEYLRRYPDGPAAGRVRERLRVMALSTRPGHNGPGTSGEDESPWRIYGGASQLYRRDDTQLENSAVNSQFTSQNALLNDAALVARRRGERFDFSSRMSATYIKDFMTNGPGDQTRVSAMFAELSDRELAWRARLGRQSGAANGIFGTFDGLAAGYQLAPRWRLSATAGIPLESTRDSPDTHRQFAGMGVDFGTFGGGWDTALYTVFQNFHGLTDRRSVGTEVRYYRPGRTLVMLVDYDVHYQDLNSALLLGTLQLGERWTLNASADHRKSPLLSVSNSLIGQAATSIDQLTGLFTPSELEQLARDRTSESDLYSLALSRPLGEHWEWSIDASSTQLGGTPASGGVEAVPPSGTERAIATQAIGYGLFGGGDVSAFGLRYQTGGTVELSSIGFSTRFPWGDSWRIGPRLRVDRRTFVSDGSTEMLYAPTLRVEYVLRKFMAELEAGTELGKRGNNGADQKTTRTYFSLGYRYTF